MNIIDKLKKIILSSTAFYMYQLLLIFTLGGVRFHLVMSNLWEWFSDAILFKLCIILLISYYISVNIIYLYKYANLFIKIAFLGGARIQKKMEKPFVNQDNSTIFLQSR